MTTALSIEADIYFEAKVMGPVSNIMAVDKVGIIKSITDNIRWRDINPVVSPQGDIAFVSNRIATVNGRQDLPENFNIYIIDKPSAKPKQVTHNQGDNLFPQFSPNGEWLAYVNVVKKRYTLNIVRRDGTRTRTLATAEEIFDVSWSPDGGKLAVTQIDGDGSHLYTVDMETANTKTRVSATTLDSTQYRGKEADRRPDLFRTYLVSSQWSPDGKRIAYITHPAAREGHRALWVVHLETTQKQLLSSAGIQPQTPLKWSRDSRRILYSALVDFEFYYDENIHRKVYNGGMHIFVSDLEGKSRQLTSGDHFFARPIYSPDEKTIAFLYSDTLADTRALSLRIMDTNGGNIRELFDSVTARSSLHWY